MVRRSPSWWALLVGTIISSLAIEFLLLWWARGTVIADTAPFIAVVPIILLSNIATNRLFERHRSAVWLAHHVCPNCGYNLTGNASGTCPECGIPVTATVPQEA